MATSETMPSLAGSRSKPNQTPQSTRMHKDKAGSKTYFPSDPHVSVSSAASFYLLPSVCCFIPFRL